jgi:hypothetical protein
MSDINSQIENFLKLNEYWLFRLDFKIFEFPFKKENPLIIFDKMNINSANIFIPIINIDNNNLKYCLDTLNINLGKICPIYKINPKNEENEIKNVVCECKLKIINIVKTDTSFLFIESLENEIQFKINFSQNPTISEDNIEFYKHF